MKVLSLLKLLKIPERKRMQSVQKIVRHNSIQDLLKYLFKVIDRDDELDKEKAYSLAFKKEYKKDQDYKLRRLLTTISQATKELIIEIQFEKNRVKGAAYDDLLYAEALLERESYDMMYKEITAMKKARNLQHPLFSRFDFKSALYTIEYSWWSSQPGIETRLRNQLKFLDEWKNHEALSAARMTHHIQADVMYHKSNLEYWEDFLAKGHGLPKQPEIESIDLIQFDNDFFVKVNKFLQQAQQQNLSDRIVTLKKILDLEKESVFLERGYQMLLKTTYNRLANSSYILARWEDALYYIKAGVNILQYLPEGSEAIPHANLINTYFISGKYQESIDHYLDQLEMISSSSRVSPQVRTNVAASYLMLGKIEEAKQLVFINSRISNFKKNADRQILAICFYQEGHADIMEREIQNALQLLKVGDGLNEDFFTKTNHWLRRFANARQLPKLEQTQKLSKLYKEVCIHDFGKNNNVFQRYISVVWLKQELGKKSL